MVRVEAVGLGGREILTVFRERSPSPDAAADFPLRGGRGGGTCEAVCGCDLGVGSGMGRNYHRARRLTTPQDHLPFPAAGGRRKRLAAFDPAL